MLFEKFIQHQKPLLTVAAVLGLVAFGIGPAIVGFFGNEEETDGGAELNGTAISPIELRDLASRLENVSHLTLVAGEAWKVDDDFVHAWLVLLAMADANGLVVSPEEIERLDEDIAIPWSQISIRGLELGEPAEEGASRSKKVEIGRKRMKKRTADWNKARWQWIQYEQTVAEWAKIRKLLSFLLEAEVKVSIDEVFKSYQGENTEYRIRYAEIDSQRALALLRSTRSDDELRREALEAYLAANRRTTPAFNSLPEADFVVLVPSEEDAREKAATLPITDEVLATYYESHLDRYRDMTGFDEARSFVESDILTDRTADELRRACNEAMAEYLRAGDAKTLAEVALDRNFEFRRIHRARPDEVSGSDFSTVDATRLSRAVFFELEPGDIRVLPGQLRPDLLLPVLVELNARRRVEAEPALAGPDQKAGPGVLSEDDVLEAFFEANRGREAFRVGGSVTFEAIVARRDDLARSILVTTEELEQFYRSYKRQLYPGEVDDDGNWNGPSFEEARLVIEPILVQRRIEERLSNDLDDLREGFTEEDKKKRSFELVADHEGLEWIEVGPIDEAGIEGHPIFGAAEGFARAVLALEKDAVTSKVFDAGDVRFFARVVEKVAPEEPTWQTVDRDLVVEELLREHAADSAERLMGDVYAAAEEEAEDTEASSEEIFRRACARFGLEVRETERFRDTKNVPYKGMQALPRAYNNADPGEIGRPVDEPGLEKAFLVQLIEREKPSRDSMEPHVIRQIRATLIAKNLEQFRTRWTDPAWILGEAEKLGYYKPAEKKGK